MRQLFTCLLVVFLFVTTFSNVFALHDAVPNGRQMLGLSVPPANYTVFFADQKPILLTYPTPSGQVTSVSLFPYQFHLSNPIA